MRNLALRVVGALVFASGPVSADPLTLDALLGLETFGRVSVDPSGAVAVFEERRARGDLPRYDLQPEGALRYARLYRFDLETPQHVRPLLPMNADAGYTLGPYSPDGRRLVVFRLQGLTFRLGVVDLATSAVRWTDLSPETGAWGRSVQWISNSELLVLGMSEGELPPRLVDLIAVQSLLPDRWTQAARGEPSFLTVGEGSALREPARRILWRVDARDGKATFLSEGPFLDFEAAPDGGHVALILEGRLLPPPDVETATEYRRARSLRLIDLESGAGVDPAAAQDISTSLLAWSPRSDSLLVSLVGERPARIVAVAASGEVLDETPPGVSPDTAVDIFGSPTAHAGWLEQDPVVRGVVEGRLGWHVRRGDTTRTIAGLSGSARVVAQGDRALLFSDRGRIVRLTRELALEDVGTAAAVDRPDGPLGHRAQTDPMGAVSAAALRPDGRLCRIMADNTEETCAPGAAGAGVSWGRGVSVQPGSNGRAVNELEVRSDNGVRLAWRLNPELDGVETPEAHLVEGPRGARGWLYLPQASTGEPPPVVVIPYPGRTYPAPPRTMRPETAQMTLNGALLVAAGYAVLYPDLPPVDAPAENLAGRILAVADAAAGEGLVDPDRIGLWGHSFGAWAVVLSATQSPRFRAVVALNHADCEAGQGGDRRASRQFGIARSVACFRRFNDQIQACDGLAGDVAASARVGEENDRLAPPGFAIEEDAAGHEPGRHVRGRSLCLGDAAGDDDHGEEDGGCRLEKARLG